MFSRLGRTVVRRRRLILALTGVFVVVAAVVGVNVFERLGRRGFDDPASESYRARQILEDELRAGDPDVVLLVDAGEAGVDDPAVVSAGEALTAELASADSVASAVSYWSLGGAAPLRDDAGREAIVLVDLTGTEREVADAATAIIEDYTGRDGPLTIGVGDARPSPPPSPTRCRSISPRPRGSPCPPRWSCSSSCSAACWRPCCRWRSRSWR